MNVRLSRTLALPFLTVSVLIFGCMGIRNRNIVEIWILPQPGIVHSTPDGAEGNSKIQGSALARIVEGVVTPYGFLDDTQATVEAIEHGHSSPGDFEFFAVFVKPEGKGPKSGRDLFVICNVYLEIGEREFVVTFEENRHLPQMSEFLTAMVTEAEESLSKSFPGIQYRVVKRSERASVLDP